MSTPTSTADARLAKDWLMRLCRVDSTSGREAELLPVLVPILREAGAQQVETHSLGDGRCNVLATWGKPRLLFSTHLDTVPPFIPPSVRDGALWGRGTCDAKGQIVAQLMAIQRLQDEGLGGFAWLGVAGEETDSLGAAKARALKSRLVECVALINGEPTELKLAAGQRGVEHWCLRCVGKSAHSGSPELGTSASWSLIDWLTRLRAEALPVDANLGPEIWNLGLLRGGEATNVVSSHASADLLARTVPGTRFGLALEATRPPEGLAERRLAEPWDQYPDIPGFEQAPMPFGSDAPQLRDLIGDRTVVLVGPGSISVAHTAEEHLRFEDLHAGIDLLAELGRYFLTKEKRGGKARKRLVSAS
ncbi:MAG TPA: M20/M25/M40 family metallo-hydrolase [Holophagaceae bacterium]|nr:M20/M25/M40 family metallo-hydrolase [Holophagaceae bacterium]